MKTWNDFYSVIQYSLKHKRVRLSGYVFLSATVVFILIMLAVWLPAYRSYIELWNTQAQYSNDIKQISHRDALETAYSINDSRVRAIEKKLTTNNGQTELIRNIASLARNNKINIINESYSESKNLDNFVLLNQSLIIEGSYFMVQRFLRDIHDLDTWTIIQETRLEAINDKKIVKATLKLTTYRSTSRSS